MAELYDDEPYGDPRQAYGKIPFEEDPLIQRRLQDALDAYDAAKKAEASGLSELKPGLKDQAKADVIAAQLAVKAPPPRDSQNIGKLVTDPAAYNVASGGRLVSQRPGDCACGKPGTRGLLPQTVFEPEPPLEKYRRPDGTVDGDAWALAMTRHAIRVASGEGVRGMRFQTSFGPINFTGDMYSDVLYLCDEHFPIAQAEHRAAFEKWVSDPWPGAEE